MDKEKENRPHRRGGFTFKRFFVAHDKCGMKVTTDGIMLGSWAAVSERCRRVLDIGTGTGLLALMLAQRSADDVTLDAVEIDEDAALQASENVAASPWPRRIRVFQTDINAFAEGHSGGYDLIISNPPYFELGCECRDTLRSKARYTATLDHQSLLRCADALLDVAQKLGWFVRRRAWVSDREGRPPYVTLLELVKAPCLVNEEYLFIREPDGRCYTECFRRLTGDFYLSL